VYYWCEGCEGCGGFHDESEQHDRAPYDDRAWAHVMRAAARVRDL
jgi:hypothetical protein